MACSTPRSLKSRRKELPVPSGRNASVGRPPVESLRIEAVYDFIRSTVAADGDEVPRAAGVSVARDFRGVTRRVRQGDLHFDAARLKRAKAGPRSLRLRPPPAAGFTIAR